MVGLARFSDSYFLSPFLINGGTFSRLRDFSADCVCYSDITYPRAINNNGEYGGWHYASRRDFENNNGGLFGFATIYGYQHTIYADGVYGMNDRRQIVGSYFDENLWRTVGYVADLPK
jgi:hypothetical protein